MKKLLIKYTIIFCSILFFLSALLLLFSLPKPLFNKPYSTVLLDRNNELLAASIAEDEQWRFPETDVVSDKFISCITEFEDKRFFKHHGVDIKAIIAATVTNIKRKSIVRGASTISMQTIRLSRDNKNRTFAEKFIESLLALRLELSYSKNEILALYASHAPFGGNVVGIEAAAWRYFGRNHMNLTWAENAMLAVLPNSPSLIHTKRNRQVLKDKRDLLLLKLFEKDILSEQEYLLSLQEDIPKHPYPYPLNAYHLLNLVKNQNLNSKSKHISTVDINIQKKVNNIANRYQKKYAARGIENIAVLVLDVATGEVLAYVGNADFSSKAEGRNIDMIQSPRSTGSILKPFLYTAMLTEGILLPNSFMTDIPIKINGYMPENFDGRFDGFVNANEALTRSRNIPFVIALKKYGIGKFIHILNNLGIKSVDKSADYYGLSLILGGAEAPLWEITAAYASMARSLNFFNDNNSSYSIGCYNSPKYLQEKNKESHLIKPVDFFSAAAIWHCLNSLTGVLRPGNESNWQMFSSKQKVAWKTGTSFGFRDAWTVGVNPNYALGVWVGNANGNPNPEIIGVKTAAPLFFEVLACLPNYKNWFKTPLDDLVEIEICQTTGFIAAEACLNKKTELIPYRGARFEKCPYHKFIFLDENENYRVNANCYPISKMKKKAFLDLPPAMEYYYLKKNAFYNKLPELYYGCQEYQSFVSEDVMDVVYPNNLSEIYIPIDLKGDTLGVVFKAKHKDENAVIFWHINDDFYTSTKNIHEQSFNLSQGKYKLSLIDDKGNSISRNFKILSEH